MGFSPNQSSSSKIPTTLSEINVTPFVDVMLVLLIIFMVSAPLMQQGAQIDLPKASTGALNENPDQVFLTVKKSEEIMINDKPIEKGTLRKRLLAISTVKPEVQVYIRADQKVAYGYIAQIIAEVKRANIHRVGLVTEPGSSTPESL